jgi:hypothetical protein
MKNRKVINPNNNGRDVDINFFWESNNNKIEKCNCPCCIDLKNKILHDNFCLGVVVGFGH